MVKRTHAALGVTAALIAGAALAVPASASTSHVNGSAGVTVQVETVEQVAAVKGKKPTVVLVHGAWADSGSWSGVIQKLRKDGYPVRAAANPLRGIANDAASVRSLVNSIEGPVVLVGHSYGGAVISDVANNNPKVKSLVYLAAFVPEKGESVGELSARKVANPLPAPPLVTVPTGETSADIYLDPSKFRGVFAGDVSKREAGVLAATQRPVAAAAFGEKATAAAKKSVPAWYLVTTKDKAISPETQAFMAKRAGAKTSKIGASHAVMVSQPTKVAKLIETAAR